MHPHKAFCIGIISRFDIVQGFMNEEDQPVYEFGAFRLNPKARLLLLEGKRVALTPKVFDTLLLLVQHHGQLLEKSS